MPTSAEKKSYAHLAEICKKCDNMLNTWQSYIRMELTCLNKQKTFKRVTQGPQ